MSDISSDIFIYFSGVNLNLSNCQVLNGRYFTAFTPPYTG